MIVAFIGAQVEFSFGHATLPVAQIMTGKFCG